MARYIDADLIPIRIRLIFSNFQRVAYEDEINKVPTADVKPVVIGNWGTVQDMGSGRFVGYWCSVCEEQHDYRTPYCPNCGARMEVEE